MRIPPARPPAVRRRELSVLPPPAWIESLVLSGEWTHARARTTAANGRAAVDLELREAGPFLHIIGTVPAAACSRRDTLHAGVGAVYEAMLGLASDRGRHAVRFWNVVPGICEPMGDGLDRYMVFNAGRYEPCSRWFGPALGGSLATATCVGIDEGDLVIDCLASSLPASPLENPRQIPAWRYSRRYGPRPPCFARATRTVLNDRTVLLVGGTASVVGEDSAHPGDVPAQLDETLRNVEALIAAGIGGTGDPLARLRDARIYVADAVNAKLALKEVRRRCPGLERLECLTARICRPELGIEIEGVAW